MRGLQWILMLSVSLVALPARGAALQKPSRSSSIVGRVLSDSAERPLNGATLSIPSLRLSVVTDSLGRFRLDGIVPGRHVVAVMHAGFTSLQTSIVFAASDSVEADILLTPSVGGSAQAVETVNVTADRTPRGLEDFERRRLHGNGDFLTEEMIRKAGGGLFVDVIRKVPGIQLSRAPGGFGSYASAGRGATRGRPCYVSVMIDRSWVYEGRPGQLPFDLSSITPDIVIAVEFYRGLSSIPTELGKQISTCGTLVIWTKQG
jgi:hypothetical protein